MRIRATARIPHLLDDLNRVDAELAFSRGKDSVRKLREAREALSIRLAENLAIVGRYDLAAEIEPRSEHQKDYAKKARLNLK
jgi:hypothetical protein